jgi:hypothetical protein
MQTVFSKDIIRSYNTDLCTGWFDKSFKYDWSRCCAIHDLYFWAGGTKEHRKLADKRLRSCVKEEANGFHAALIYFGVKAGSLSPLKIKAKKWGNAWDSRYQHSPLSINDIKRLKTSLLSTLETNPDLADLLNHSELDDFFTILKNHNL